MRAARDLGRFSVGRSSRSPPSTPVRTHPGWHDETQATEWALTGDRVSAAEAHAAGVVNRLVPTGQAQPAALELAQQIASNGPLAVQGTKRVLTEGGAWPAEEAFARQWAIYEPIRSSADAQEGARAFTEKRAPRWQGH